MIGLYELSVNLQRANIRAAICQNDLSSPTPKLRDLTRLSCRLILWLSLIPRALSVPWGLLDPSQYFTLYLKFGNDSVYWIEF